MTQRIKLSWCRWSLLGLILLQPLWWLWLAPPQVMPAALALGISLLPLLPVLPGVWRLHQRPLVIAGFILMFHFCLGVMEAWSNPTARAPALMQVILVSLYFIALPTIRRRQASSD